jgi:UrcA family protein
MNTRRTIALVTALTAGLMASSLVWAQASVAPIVVHGQKAAGTETKDETIKVADLNLKSAAGAETFIGRVRSAASRVCKPKPTSKGNFKDVSDYDKCRDDAVKQAVADLNNPMVSEVYNRTGG